MAWVGQGLTVPCFILQSQLKAARLRLENDIRHERCNRVALQGKRFDLLLTHISIPDPRRWHDDVQRLLHEEMDILEQLLCGGIVPALDLTGGF